MKKYLCILFAMILLASSISVSANTNEMKAESVKQYFLDNGFSVKKVSKPLELFNLDGELVATYYTIDNAGYVIVNNYTGNIEEFSFAKKHDYKDKGYKNIYNGLLNYYVEDQEGILYDAKSLEKLDKDQLKNKYTEDVFNTDSIDELNDASTSNSVYTLSTYSSVVHEELSGSLEEWSPSFSTYCNLDSVALLLKYYETYRSGAWLPTGYKTCPEAHNYLITFKIIPNASMNLYDVK